MTLNKNTVFIRFSHLKGFAFPRKLSNCIYLCMCRDFRVKFSFLWNNIYVVTPSYYKGFKGRRPHVHEWSLSLFHLGLQNSTPRINWVTETPGVETHLVVDGWPTHGEPFDEVGKARVKQGDIFNETVDSLCFVCFFQSEQRDIYHYRVNYIIDNKKLSPESLGPSEFPLIKRL